MKKFILGLMSATIVFPSVSFAAFVEDSNVTFTARNFYLDRNFVGDDATQPASKQWVQGFILNAKSGFTEGPVGFGVDVLIGSGINLWGDKQYYGTALTPLKSDLEPVSTFTKGSIAGKLKFSQTELKVGGFIPVNPVLVGSQARLLPQIYRGVALESKEIQNLKLEAGYVNRVNHRDSTNYEKIKLSGANQKYKSVETSGLTYAGGYYDIRPETTLSLFYANLDDIYNQYTFWIKNNYKIDEQYNVFTDFRIFRTVDAGESLAGEVDNYHGNIAVTLGVDNHKFTAGYIYNSGKTGFPYLSGGEANTYMDAWATDFLNPKEKAYSIRYDYDFKKQVPGLKLMTRYTKGHDIELVNLVGDDRKLTERKFGIELSYQIQSTFLKGVNIRLRHEDYKNDFGPKATFKSAKEQRVNIDYTWKF